MQRRQGDMYINAMDPFPYRWMKWERWQRVSERTKEAPRAKGVAGGPRISRSRPLIGRVAIRACRAPSSTSLPRWALLHLSRSGSSEGVTPFRPLKLSPWEGGLCPLRPKGRSLVAAPDEVLASSAGCKAAPSARPEGDRNLKRQCGSNLVSSCCPNWVMRSEEMEKASTDPVNQCTRSDRKRGGPSGSLLVTPCGWMS